jgi:hypothetical protein
LSSQYSATFSATSGLDVNLVCNWGITGKERIVPSMVDCWGYGADGMERGEGGWCVGDADVDRCGISDCVTPRQALPSPTKRGDEFGVKILTASYLPL